MLLYPICDINMKLMAAVRRVDCDFTTDVLSHKCLGGVLSFDGEGLIPFPRQIRSLHQINCSLFSDRYETLKRV